MSYKATQLGTQLIDKLTLAGLHALKRAWTKFNQNKVLVEDNDLKAITQLKIMNTSWANGKRFYTLKPEYFLWSE